MRVIGLDGREAVWKLSGLRVAGDSTRTRSVPHLRARGLLARVFPCDQVLEEVPIPGSRLRLDFLVSTRTIAVEVQGEQHFSFNAHFYKNKHEFAAAMRNDAAKRRFCGRNGITLAVLRHDGTDDDWRRILEAG